jgi:catechol 2,3-dioxygenase-like lactoylglutathione lyase family enzyme
MRLQLALNVRNLDEAVDFYSRLFDATPHKRREGYANFAIDSPPLKLVLFENPGAPERLNHLGVEVFSPAEVETARERFAEAGILDSVEEGVLCCHATQDKIWANEPQGLKWEWYRISDDNPDETGRPSAWSTGETAEAERAVCCG